MEITFLTTGTGNWELGTGNWELDRAILLNAELESMAPTVNLAQLDE